MLELIHFGPKLQLTTVLHPAHNTSAQITSRFRDSVADTTGVQFNDIHFKGVFFLAQKALPLLNDGGRIISVSSGLTQYSFAGSSVDASLKGAVEVFSWFLAEELGA